jgi:hypothetical protein
VAITIYISNLHPTGHARLYSTLKKIIAETIPLWNVALSHIDMKHGQRIPEGRTSYGLPLGEARPLKPSKSEDDDYWGENDTWLRNTRVLILPDPREFAPSIPEGLLRTNLPEEFAERSI